jgi:hypothetical protein
MAMVVRTPLAGLMMVSLLGVICGLAIPRVPAPIDHDALRRTEVANRSLQELARIERELHELDLRIVAALHSHEGCHLVGDAERARDLAALADARVRLARARAEDEARRFQRRKTRLHGQ